MYNAEGSPSARTAVRVLSIAGFLGISYFTISATLERDTISNISQHLLGPKFQNASQCLAETPAVVTRTISSAATVTVVSLPAYLDDTDNEGVRDPPKAQARIDYKSKLGLGDFERLKEVQELLSDSDFRLKSLRSMYGMDGERTWLQHLELMPDDHLFPLTKFAQQAIHAHQHPPTCEGKSFISVPVFTGSGIGSAVHAASIALGTAMMNDKIVVYDTTKPPMSRFIEPDEMGTTDSFQTLFEELTSCQSFANERNTQQFSQNYDYFDRPTLPILGQALLDQFPDMTPNAQALWARAQHVAYVMRLRPTALAYLAKNRLNSSVQIGFVAGQEIAMPFPLPQRSWSIHVRHGDKGSEMRLVPFSDFVVAAERYSMQNPIESRKWAFVSSDDPEVFEEMKTIVSIKDSETVSNREWHWFMSNQQRSSETQFQQLVTPGENKTETTLAWLSQLFLALECDGFVGTRGSNWNSLIEELRGVWAPAARGPYLEVARERDWMNYPCR